MSGQFVRQLRWRWALVVAAANVVGAGVVFVFLRTFHAVEGVRVSEEHTTIGVELFVVYLAAGLLAGLAWRERRTRDMWRWLRSDRTPQSHERDLALHEPLRELVANSTLWAGATLLFGVFNISMSAASALEHVVMISLGGLTTCALVYLCVDRLLRPATARALAAGAPTRPIGPGVRARLISAWVLASGVLCWALDYSPSSRWAPVSRTPIRSRSWC
jgi:adenylate cyclase